MSSSIDNIDKDIDRQETKEWLEALEAVIKKDGDLRANFLINQLITKAKKSNIKLDLPKYSNFSNTIPAHQHPTYPGNLEIEYNIANILRWNTIAMVIRGGKNPGIGGHISTYSSIANLFEVGFNHFFRSFRHNSGGDLIYFQGHSVEGIYARSFLTGELNEKNLEYFRREALNKDGISSYPHPHLMPEYWQFPTVSMGLGALQAIYQAKFLQYLDNRGICDTKDRKVWCFCGDGEMDEPESRGAVHIAGRENLNNLIFVINSNLQRLDGPVYGNGKIIQELEALFSASGWNVIKVIWGKKWDALLERDTSGLLQQRMNEIVDGDLQSCTAHGGAYAREHFFGKYPELTELVKDLSDDELRDLMLDRGGHDHEKIYAAYDAAVKHQGQPTLIITFSVKGYGLGEKYGESENTAHNMDKLDAAGLKKFVKRFNLPISEDQIESLPFYKPEDNSAEVKYLKTQREKLGGSYPARRTQSDNKIPVPKLDSFSKILEGSENPMSTTMAFGRIFATLLRDKSLAKYLVPIFSDEARTFGMESLFRQIGIYSSKGQQYEPEDKKSLIAYREAKNGQVLEEGITEAGCTASWIAAASSYSSNNQTMIPFFVFYSMFGFQRCADLIWAASDIKSRGFLMGATAGRTTLNGEGLQHEDGHSHLMAITNPNCVAYDPAFNYELAVIIQHGLYEMYELEKDVFYYITIMNENYCHPAMPNTKDVVDGIINGIYLFKESENKNKDTVNLFGSGAILNEVIKAAEILEREYNISANIWSVTSYNNLVKDGMSTARHNLLNPDKDPKIPYLTKALEQYKDYPIIAASDYIRSHKEQVRAYLPNNNFTTLGTDGFGRSDTREALREFFEVSANHIVLAALKAVNHKELKNAVKKLNITQNRANPWEA